MAEAIAIEPVFLTSVTTIGGLFPLMTETSFQAQFLVPMATSLVFGLAATTLIVLVSCLSCIHFLEHSRTRQWMKNRIGRKWTPNRLLTLWPNVYSLAVERSKQVGSIVASVE